MKVVFVLCMSSVSFLFSLGSRPSMLEKVVSWIFWSATILSVLAFNDSFVEAFPDSLFVPKNCFHTSKP